VIVTLSDLLNAATRCPDGVRRLAEYLGAPEAHRWNAHQAAIWVHRKREEKDGAQRNPSPKTA